MNYMPNALSAPFPQSQSAAPTAPSAPSAPPASSASAASSAAGSPAVGRTEVKIEPGSANDVRGPNRITIRLKPETSASQAVNSVNQVNSANQLTSQGAASARSRPGTPVVQTPHNSSTVGPSAPSGPSGSVAAAPTSASASASASAISNHSALSGSTGYMGSLSGNSTGLGPKPVPRGSKPEIRVPKFCVTEEDFLRKYGSAPPSLEFHIYDKHYRFGRQEGIIPKSNPMIHQFLEHVAREEIPPYISEILRDTGIRYYEGCLILHLYDHRNSNSDTERSERERAERERSEPQRNSQPARKLIEHAKLFRVVLKPTELEQWYDIIALSDPLQHRFTDDFATYITAQVTNITTVKVDTAVPLNPYRCSSYVPLPRGARQTPGRHWHRPEVPGNHVRALHEDLPHNSTELEDLMLLLDDTPQEQTDQLVRIGFIEQWRRRREKMLQLALAHQMSRTQARKKLGGPPGSAGGGLAGQAGQVGQAGQAGQTGPVLPDQHTQIQLQQQMMQQARLNFSQSINALAAAAGGLAGDGGRFRDSGGAAGGGAGGSGAAGGSGGGSADVAQSPGGAERREARDGMKDKEKARKKPAKPRARKMPDGTPETPGPDAAPTPVASGPGGVSGAAKPKRKTKKQKEAEQRQTAGKSVPGKTVPGASPMGSGVAKPRKKPKKETKKQREARLKAEAEAGGFQITEEVGE